MHREVVSKRKSSQWVRSIKLKRHRVGVSELVKFNAF